ncbi:MAG: Inositol-phosphate phosphatase [Parcubacteria group bacterium GW2011_GWA2_49_9]|nr:MAG: Inositol-phosphate phosphatase [Parcubacteria group bacterium GW2011_GWA2_49_9]
MADTQKFLEVALEAVKKAEPIFLKSFGNAEKIEIKSDAVGSEVSRADKEIEHILTEAVSGAFPDHAIMGEEGASKSGSFYTWYFDPIDGTTNHIRGLHHCAISVALWDAHGPLVGIVSDPVNKVCFTATRGGGAFKNGRPIRVSHLTSLKKGVGALGWNWNDARSRNALLDAITKNTYRFRVFSGSGLELCFVAAGILDFFVNINLHIWDMAAASLIVTEAGGMVTDKKGSDLSALSTSIVATNTKIHGDLLAALK